MYIFEVGAAYNAEAESSRFPLHLKARMPFERFMPFIGRYALFFYVAHRACATEGCAALRKAAQRAVPRGS